MNARKMTQNDAEVNAPTTLAELQAFLRSLKIPKEDGGAAARVVISARVAKEILEACNSENRRCDEIFVQKYRRDMESNKWLPNGELGLGLLAGLLVVGNGQHRLTAQVESGTDQSYLVRVFDDQDEFDVYVATVDCPRVRGLSDMLRIFGVAKGQGNAVASERVLNSIHTFTGAKVSRRSTGERLTFAQPYLPAVAFAIKQPRKTFKAHVLAALAFGYTKHPKATKALVESVVSGADLPARSPAHELLLSLQDFNGAKGMAQKDRAIANVLRIVWDAAKGRETSRAKSIVRSATSPVIDAISALVSREAANAWLVRQGITK